MDSKTLCLGVLTLGDASGYEINKQFEEGPFAHIHATGFGSIYPALSALLKDGLVTCTPMAQDGKPDKKVYSLTDAGRRAFVRALHRAPSPDSFRSDAVFTLFFAELLEPDHLSAVFDRYLSVHRAHVERMTRGEWGLSGPGYDFVHGLGLAIYRTITDYMERHRSALLEVCNSPAGRPEPTPVKAAE